MKKLTGLFIGLVFLLCAFSAHAQELTSCLDAPDIVWDTWGTEDWFCQSDESYDGVSAAQSGPIADNETGITYLEAEVTVEEVQQLSFHWKLSSNSGDHFYFYLNDEEQFDYSGSDYDWRQRTVQLLPGTNTLRWEFNKGQVFDNSSAWIDNIMIDDVHALDLLAYYADTYKTPSIPQPLFAKNRVAKAEADECYDNGTVGEPDEFDNCTAGDPKVNQAYVWGMARSGNLWFGTVSNTQCLVIGGLAGGLGIGLPAIEAPNFVCEFSGADNATNSLGDWRPPQIFEYVPDTMQVLDHTPQDLFDNPTLGIRSAGALGGVVLLAGPSLDGTAVNMFAFADDGTYLGFDILSDYNNIRDWVVYDGVMYTGVKTTVGDEGRILRWNGDAGNPFDFEVVGITDLDATNMAVHRNRLFVTTWPSLSVMSMNPNVSGLYMSPEIQEGIGLTGSDNESWVKVWSATDYEPDMVVARTYGGGALASYDGTLFWGTMHVPFSGTLAAIVASERGLINLKGLDNETMGEEDIVATALGTHRAISIFSSTFETSETTIDLLYGDEYLPVYDPAARSYTIAEDDMHRNNMEYPEPKWGPSGIGNFFNAYTWTMDVGFEDNRGGVLLGTFDWSFVARDMVGLLLEQVVDDETEVGMAVDLLMMVFDGFMEGYSYGADLFVIRDADAPFIFESSDGAGNYLNYGIRTMLMPSSAAEASMTAPAVMAEDECGLGYFGMANPFNLADEGGWELISIYPLPELALIAPTAQQFVMGDFTLQAQDLSACSLGSVEFVITDALAQSSVYSADNNIGAGFWEYVLDTTLMPNGIYTALTRGSDSDGVMAVDLPVLFVVANDCVQDSECDDGLFCTGVEMCDNGTCAPGPQAACGEEEVCIEDSDTCVPRECSQNSDCDDDLFCTGVEICEEGLCDSGALPCNNEQICVEDINTCLPRECSEDIDCDDGLFCTGTEMCESGFCVPGTVPCDEQVCAEDKDLCVECLINSDCSFGYMCEEVANVCAVDCPLTVVTKKDKPIIVKPGKNGKVRKDKKVKLYLSGGEGFDPEGIFDAGPFTYDRRKYKEKKGQLQIKITIPGELAPGTYQISVGECLGEVTFTEKQ